MLNNGTTIGWTKLDVGRFKRNNDGASKGNPSHAVTRGLIRDVVGRWVGGFFYVTLVSKLPLRWSFES